MDISDLIEEGADLFVAKEYVEAIQKLNEVLNSILDKNNHFQEQIRTHFWLGRCYLEQALQTKDFALFDKAREHHWQQLALAEQLGGEDCIQQQITAYSWLGGCYLEQALQTRNLTLFRKAHEFLQQRLVLAEQLNGENCIRSRGDAHFSLGYCYLEQALKTQDLMLFEKAREHFWKQLELAEQLNGEDRIQQQFYAYSWLGHCYWKEVKQKSLGKKEKIALGKQYVSQAVELWESMKDSAFKRENNPVNKPFLRKLYFLVEKYQEFFNYKKESIQKKLPEHLDADLKEAVASVLAVLTISPIEFDKPLAHYTSPTVCEKLLGIGQKQQHQANIATSKMRMNSSAYMNDPYEGRSLHDFLGIQEPALENLTEFSRHNAFFACFSARINDLNQFRLYGKVNETEASGCCLVFNKHGDWIQEPNISASYQYLNARSRTVDNPVEAEEAEAQQPSASLPLYQIAYIFYRDEYTQHDEYDVMDSDEIFGVRLKPISDNTKWHEVRKQKLQTALKNLRKYFKKPAQKQESKAALEYIRYLFKDHAFRDEEEFRLLKIEDSGSDKVQYCPTTNATFLEYGDICTKLDEVILGTNYERTKDGRKVEVFRHLLKRKNLNIKVSHSSLPINPPRH